MDLLAVFALAPSVGAAIELLLDDRTAIRDEREGPAVGRKARMPVVADAEGQLASGGRPVDRDDPQGAAIGIEPGSNRQEADDRKPAIGRQAGLGGDPEPEQVVGARRTGHGHLRAIGTPEV